MLKKSIKRIFTLFVCVCLLSFNALPAFAKGGKHQPSKPPGIALVDGASISVRSLTGTATYSMEVPDTDERFFNVMSTVPVRVLLQVVGESNSTCFDSGDFRMGPVSVGLHLLPRAQYTLVVMTQNNVEANVTVGMTKLGGLSSVYLSNNTSMEERNVLGVVQNEILDFQFKSAGKYRVSLSVDIPNFFYGSLYSSSMSSGGQASGLLTSSGTYYFDPIDVPSTIDSNGNIMPFKCYLTVYTAPNINANLLGKYKVNITKIG
ncbi:hypothetical protein [Clostridium tagluense]|uniref:hypothetical protein n=1 Tax=Clostridium tagluense TaxID=360422 RepID=UPI001C6F0DB2|nr:hypothetical protein [Clostridium tagluense]MBW9156987.1 hypothetical protein [Clostridium tagluense]WLC64974.1 hypothetical protein KTC93_19360 [Clostridium tagluense]